MSILVSSKLRQPEPKICGSKLMKSRWDNKELKADLKIEELKHEANSHIAKITEKLEVTQRKAREIIETVRQEAAKEVSEKTRILEAEATQKERQLRDEALQHIEQQKGILVQELQNQ